MPEAPSRELVKTDAKKFMDLVQALKPKMAAVLPKHVNPERMLRLFLVGASRMPALYDCTRESVASSLMTASFLGLEPFTPLGYCWILPFKQNLKLPNGQWRTSVEATFIAGYQGMIELAYRTGSVQNIWATPVFQGEEFSLVEGLQPTIIHKPNPDSPKDPKQLRGAYAVCLLKDGAIKAIWCNRWEIDQARSRSKAPNGPAWTNDYVAMAQKTAVRRLFKWIPKGTELRETLTSIAEHCGDDALGDILDTTAQVIADAPSDAVATPPPSGTERLAETVGQIVGRKKPGPKPKGTPPDGSVVPATVVGGELQIPKHPDAPEPFEPPEPSSEFTQSEIDEILKS
jgi:recombination protein RecT